MIAVRVIEKKGGNVKKNLSYLASAAALAAGSAFSPAASAQFYLGAGMGQDHAKLPSLSTTVSGVPVTAAGANSNETAWKAYGGYQFTPHWGLEGGYTRLGTDHRVGVTVGALSGGGKYKLDSWQLSGTGTLPFDGGFSLIGKLGVTRNHASGDNVCIAGICESLGSTHRTNMLWGVGAQIALTKALSVRLEYEDYGTFAKDVYAPFGGGSLKADAWSLSVKYSF